MATGTRSKVKRKRCSSAQEGDKQPTKWQKSGFLCPLCFELLKDVYVTSCGHSFCYKCITRYVATTSQCPVCKLGLQVGGIHPNCTLNDVIAKVKLQEDKKKVLEKSSPELSEIMNAVTRMNDHDLDEMVSHLQKTRNQKRQQEDNCNDSLLLHFLLRAKKTKEQNIDLILKQIDVLTADIRTVSLKCECKPSSSEVGMAVNKEAAGAIVPSASSSSSSSLPRSGDGLSHLLSSTSPAIPPSSNVFATRSASMHLHFHELLEEYIATKMPAIEDPSVEVDDLGLFADSLKRATNFTTFKELSNLSYGDQTSYSNCSIVSSIQFDKDADFFAVAATKVIKIFDYHSVLGGVGFTNHFPVQEMTCTGQLSSVYFNDFHKSTLASSDYEGYVTVWDTSYAKNVVSHREHTKPVWSVVYNPSDPNVFASGSEDCTVKLWSSTVPHSIFTLFAKANVGTVRFNSDNRYHLAYGSADHIVHYMDLRNPKEPLYQLGRRRRACVFYVKFCSRMELVSAYAVVNAYSLSYLWFFFSRSADSELNLWNVNNGQCLRSYKGHINCKDFVGLTVTPHYIACGSENNSLYVYAKQLSRPMLSYEFNASRNILQQDGSSSNSQLRKQGEVNDIVSSVCWKPNSDVILCANNQGHIKVLEMC